MSIKTTKEMNGKIVGLLRDSDDGTLKPEQYIGLCEQFMLYAAQRIEELEAEMDRLRSAIEWMMPNPHITVDAAVDTALSEQQADATDIDEGGSDAT